MNGNPVGAVLTLRDRAELQAVIRELDTVRALADALRAYAHESANQLQALVSLIELGRYEDAVRLGTRDSSSAQRLSDQLLGRGLGRAGPARRDPHGYNPGDRMIRTLVVEDDPVVLDVNSSYVERVPDRLSEVIKPHGATRRVVPCSWQAALGR